MPEIQRVGHLVTINHNGESYTFNGLVFGITAGCWIVNDRVAKKICQMFGKMLPRLGYERALIDNKFGPGFVSNEAGRYRVTLNSIEYTYKVN